VQEANKASGECEVGTGGREGILSTMERERYFCLGGRSVSVDISGVAKELTRRKFHRDRGKKKANHIAILRGRRCWRREFSQRRVNIASRRNIVHTAGARQQGESGQA